MITHFLGQEEVDGYARDLAQRLERFGTAFPRVWCPIGYSGDRLVRIIYKFLAKPIAESIHIVAVGYDKVAGVVTEFKDPDGDRRAIREANSILVIDSSIHSGSTMLGIIGTLESLGAKNALTYSLVIKQNAKYVPHFFGVLVSDHDRTLFLLDAIPNNRLFHPKNSPIGVLRRLTESDCRTDATLNTGRPSMDKASFGDLWYYMLSHGHENFVIEIDKKIASFLSLKFSDRNLLIDLIATDDSHKNKGCASALLRWAETLARSRKCTTVELWAVSEVVKLYESHGFIQQNESFIAGSEEYIRMKRDLLYSFDLQAMRHG